MSAHNMPDVDIDLADRSHLLSLIPHTAAVQLQDSVVKRHPSGVYVTDIPGDPRSGLATIDYNEAAQRGYFKLDFLNVYVYSQVQSSHHLTQLMRPPDWSRLADANFVEKLVHLNRHYHSLQRMPQPVNSVLKLAMFLAIIRPGKKHLIGLPWQEIEKTVWDRGTDGYTFRKSHSIAYAHLVVVHLNLLCEQELG